MVSQASEAPKATEQAAAAEETKQAITTENMPTQGAVLTSDFTHLQRMYQAQNMTRGIAP